MPQITQTIIHVLLFIFYGSHACLVGRQGIRQIDNNIIFPVCSRQGFVIFSNYGYFIIFNQI